MDKMMNKMRRNLMVIRLLGLYSEDKTLQDNLMKESPRMIKFIGTTVQRAAKLLESDAVVDESSCIMGTQSLNMSLTILSLHLTQADVSSDDWKRMQVGTLTQNSHKPSQDSQSTLQRITISVQ